MFMDPIAQILAQGRTESSGPTPQYQAYAQGQQNALSRRRLDLEEQQQSRAAEEQAAVLPLKIAQMKQAQELNSLSFQTQWQQHQALLEGGKDASNAFATMSSMMREDEDPARVDAVLADFLTKNSLLAGSAPAKALTELSQNYGRAKQYKAATDARIQASEAIIAQRDAALGEKRREFDTKLQAGAIGNGGVDDFKFNKWEKMEQEAASEQDELRKEALQLRADRYRRAELPHMDEQGHIVSEGAWLQKQVPSIMQSLAASDDPSLQGLTVSQLRAKANKQAKEEYKSFMPTKKVGPTLIPPGATNTAPSAITPPAAAPAQVTAEYVPKVGFVLKGQSSSAPLTNAAVNATPTATTPTDLTDDDLVEAGKILSARGLAEEEVLKVVQDATNHPGGEGEKMIRRALRLKELQSK